uniref:NADH dehydrogenase subunit 6 n=1 Tax=Meliboeus sinae TaxID=2946727 RepID=UPI002079B6C2|nr:NADH dehydrogenase subunit 6 [Meliboeus sinae]URN73099.1 NADH dehydrogenase subunit 6 [Meliboeus sinae]
MMNTLLASFTITMLLFMLTKHPISMGATVLIKSLLISMITGTLNHNFWFSYIIFIVMVGGLLVLFIYMTSVASNEKFNISSKTTTLTIMSLFLFMILKPKINLLNNSCNTMMNFNISWMNSLVKFFTAPQSSILLLMMIYLLIALVAITKISKSDNGPLRSA